MQRRGFAVVASLIVMAGLVVGVMASYYVFLSNKNADDKLTVKEAVQTQIVVTPLSLSVNSPADGTLTGDKSVTVTGRTSADTVVAIFTDENEFSVQSGIDGTFSQKIDLVEGINTITVTAFGENDEEKSVTLDVVYNKDS